MSVFVVKDQYNEPIGVYSSRGNAIEASAIEHDIGCNFDKATLQQSGAQEIKAPMKIYVITDPDSILEFEEFTGDCYDDETQAKLVQIQTGRTLQCFDLDASVVG